VETTRAAVQLAKKAGVEMPIAEQMNAMLHQGRTPAEAIKQLMERNLKGE
jgi:glycerol-3-phosphate dehydrogenase (NAD(P)+)